jgi:hypothetical protein
MAGVLMGTTVDTAGRKLVGPVQRDHPPWGRPRRSADGSVGQ